MAIASTPTILSLDRYARIMGINPVHFNGANQIELSNGKVLFPLDNAQNNIWPQFEYQNSDQISREELARQIFIAENDLAMFIGYWPGGTWVENEAHSLDEFYRNDVGFTGSDVVGNPIRIKTRFGKVVAGGQRNSLLLKSSNAVTYVDVDGDGYKEVARVSCDIGVNSYDLRNVNIYFEGYGGDPQSEIRLAKSRSISGTTITYDFYAWHMIDPVYSNVLPTDDSDGKSLDITANAYCVTKVDIYYEYNDTTSNGCVFVYTDPYTGAVSEQGGFLRLMNEDEVVPVAANYNSSIGAWETVSCVEFDYVKINYYCGLRDHPNNFLTSPNRNDYLPEFHAVNIAYIATARLQKIFYANNNATALADNLRRDLQFAANGDSQFTGEDVSNCPFGSRYGEVYVYKRLFGFKLHTQNTGAVV